MKLTKSFALLLLAMLLFSSGSYAGPHDLRDREKLESFSDGVMYTSMQNAHVAGAVLSIVADGELIFSKGYGFRDVEKQLPVDPKQTLFRIASITKLLTWTALMQLHEQKKLELDTDINAYLTGIEIPDTFDEPITLRHLMSHTPGLEDHVVKLFSRDEEDMRPYLDILKDELPQRVRAPGDLPSYSNHGTALAALVVEQVSGRSWANYVEANILEPLAMSWTSIQQPLPASLAPHLSQGYRWLAGKYEAESFEFVPLTPAGGGSASAYDMARFMLAFLNGGELEGRRVLKPETATLMQQSLFKADPRLNSALHGFYESNRHGQRIYGHGGDTMWFHSEFMLMPDSQLGVFISTNSENGPQVRKDYINAFLERFFPYSGLPQANNFEPTDVISLVGSYATLRTSFSDFTKLGQLLSTVEIVSSSENQLMLLGAGDPQYFVETDSGLFQRVDQDQTIAFRFDHNGQASHLFFNHSPSATYERVSTLYSPALQFGLVGVSSLIFIWVLIAWPVQHFSRRWTLPSEIIRFRQLAWFLALVFISLLVCFAIAMQDSFEVVFGASTFIKVILFMNLAIPLLTLALFSQLPKIMSTSQLGFGSKTFHILVIVAGIAYSWFLYTWRMYGYL